MTSPDSSYLSMAKTLPVKMLARAAFYPTLLYNVVMEKVSSRQWYNRIDDTVLLGALPFKSITQKLKEENVTGIITLNEDYETKYFVNSEKDWQAAGMEQLKLETTDLVAAPSQQQLQTGVDFILKHYQQGSSVYVHCKAGRTRSTTLVACYLMQIHNWSPDKAVEYIHEKRPHILLRTAQWNALRLYYSNQIKNSR